MIYDGVIDKPDIDDLFDGYCIEHFGVKGMKWGVRKAVERVGNTLRTSAAKAKVKRNFAAAKILTAKKPNLLNKNVKGNMIGSVGTKALYGGVGTSYKNVSKIGKLGSSFLGTYGNQKIKKIASYNSLSSKAKRGFDSFKNTTLKKSKKVKLSSLTNGNKNSAMNSLLTSSSAARDAAAVAKGSKSFLRNITKDLRGLKSVSSKIPYADHRTGLPVNEAALKGVDDYTLSLLKKNAKRLAGW